jgi:hypothetical protein
MPLLRRERASTAGKGEECLPFYFQAKCKATAANPHIYDHYAPHIMPPLGHTICLHGGLGHALADKKTRADGPQANYLPLRTATPRKKASTSTETNPIKFYLFYF